MTVAVATSEAWTPSRRLQSAALAERERVGRELARLDDQHAQLHEALAGVVAQREELRAQLAVLNRWAHGAPDSPLPAKEQPEADGVAPDQGANEVPVAVVLLRGAAIREAAVRTLAASDRAHEALHYREWYELLIAQGLRPDGKDPLATFLTQLGRTPAVERGSEPGHYRLNYDFPEQTRPRLNQLRAELRRAHETGVEGDAEALAEARLQRGALIAQIDHLERDLEEALRALHPPDSSAHLAVVET